MLREAVPLRNGQRSRSPVWGRYAPLIWGIQRDILEQIRPTRLQVTTLCIFCLYTTNTR